jgi:hypothetical protein
MRKVNYREGLRKNYATKRTGKSAPRKATARKLPPENPTVMKSAKPATPKKPEKKAPAQTPKRQKLPKQPS